MLNKEVIVIFAGELLRKLPNSWIPSGPEGLTATDHFTKDSKSTEMTTTTTTTTTMITTTIKVK